MKIKNRAAGVSLVELVVAMAVTTVVLGASFQVVTQSSQSASLVMDRAEMQSELRAAFNELSFDLNQAGTGYPTTGINIPSASTGGTNPVFGRDATNIYLTNNNALTQGMLYKVNPGYLSGQTITEQTDAIVIVYVDQTLDWTATTDQTTTIATDGTSVTMPATVSPAVNDPAVGITAGDVLLLQNTNGTALGVVTGVNSLTRTIYFANNDLLNINQSGAPTGNIRSLINSGSPAVYPITSVSRLMVVSYFIQNATSSTPLRLMRQVGAHQASPVAENIEDLKFTYDLVDDTAENVNARSPNAVIGTPAIEQPAQIREININMTIRSARLGANKTYQRIAYSSSIGPRNLSFRDLYQ